MSWRRGGGYEGMLLENGGGLCGFSGIKYPIDVDQQWLPGQN